MLNQDQISLLYDTIGEFIKTEREKAHYKQTQFAELLRISSRASLVNIEKGRQRAPLHVLYEIARILKIEVNHIMPEVSSLAASEIKPNIQNKIIKKTAGNSLMHEKLMNFVTSESIQKRKPL